MTTDLCSRRIDRWFRDMGAGRDEILAEAAGSGGCLVRLVVPHAGMSWSPHGMLIMAAGREGKPLDYDELARWTRVEVQARHEMAQEQNAEGVYGIPSEEAGIGPRAIQVTQSKGPTPK